MLAKILQQIKGDDNPLPVEILAQASPKEPPNDSMSKFVQAYTSHIRVGALVKDTLTGKLVKEWEAALASANSKPELLDMAPALSSLMAVKDEEELVRLSLSTVFPFPLSS
jgi:nucleosome binding factor SPN SPT16 subunit